MGVITGRFLHRVAPALVVLGLASTGCSVLFGPPASVHDWTRFGWDAARSNAPDVAVGIARADLGGLVRQQVTLPGTVDASVVYLHAVRVAGAVHDAFFATTTYGRTLAIDADSGAVLWTFTPPDYGALAGTYRITTAAPVVDPDRAYLYASAPDGNVRKLAIADGHEVWSTAVTTLPEREKITAALNFANGHVLVTTGGYAGDVPPYQGHVVALDPASGALLHVWNALCSDTSGLLVPSSCPEAGAAIWARSGAVVDPSTGDLLVATGNALWDGVTSWGDAVLELAPDASHLVGNYTPTDTQQLEKLDLDLGSTAPALLGDDLIVQGGKDAKLRLLDLKELRGTAPHMGGEVQVIATPTGGQMFGAPAVWHDGGTTWLFAADTGATGAWKLVNRTLQPVWTDPHGGTSPVVAGGLLYVYDPAGALRVLDPATGGVLADLPAGAGHWNSPIVIDGRIALPEGNANDHSTTGVLDIWRLPH